MASQTSSTANGLFRSTYRTRREAEKMRLTSPAAGPKLQSQTGFDGCDTVDPILPSNVTLVRQRPGTQGKDAYSI